MFTYEQLRQWLQDRGCPRPWTHANVLVRVQAAVPSHACSQGCKVWTTLIDTHRGRIEQLAAEYGRPSVLLGERGE